MDTLNSGGYLYLNLRRLRIPTSDDYCSPTTQDLSSGNERTSATIPNSDFGAPYQCPCATTQDLSTTHERTSASTAGKNFADCLPCPT